MTTEKGQIAAELFANIKRHPEPHPPVKADAPNLSPTRTAKRKRGKGLNVAHLERLCSDDRGWLDDWGDDF